jgi:hypothetical protein
MGGILWTLITLLVLFWIVGLVMHIAGPVIHFALLAAAVLFVINMFTSSRTRI